MCVPWKNGFESILIASCILISDSFLLHLRRMKWLIVNGV